MSKCLIYRAIRGYWEVTALANANGTADVNGVTRDLVFDGTAATWTATPNSGYVFDQWNDGNTDNPRIEYVNADTSLTASFKVAPVMITTVASPVDGGTVTGGGLYNIGDTCTLTATPDTTAYYVFEKWDDGSVVNPRTETVSAAKTYTAMFKIPQVTITTVATPTLGGTVTGGGTYNVGTSVTLQATPNADYIFEKWDDGVTTNPRIETATVDMTYTAVFKYNKATITTVASPATGGTITGGGTYTIGDTVTLVATPDTSAGYVFNQWNDGDTSPTKTFAASVDVTYTAYFNAI